MHFQAERLKFWIKEYAVIYKQNWKENQTLCMNEYSEKSKNIMQEKLKVNEQKCLLIRQVKVYGNLPSFIYSAV